MKSVTMFLLKTTKTFKVWPVLFTRKVCVIDISANGDILLIENAATVFCLKRHHSNIKLFNGSLPLQSEQYIKRDCVNSNENFY